MHEYDPKRKRFVSDDEEVSRQEVREEVNKLTDYVGKESIRIAKRLASKQISNIEFELQMQDLLKSGHIIAASVGKGGRERMTQADWGQVGSKIKWQNQYLQKFARKAKNLSDSQIQSRARSYSSAIYTSFAKTFKEAQTEFVKEGKNPTRCRLVTNSEEGCAECAADEAAGWMSVDDMGEIGSRICGDFCKCDIEFSDDLNAADLDFKVKVSFNDDSEEE